MKSFHRKTIALLSCIAMTFVLFVGCGGGASALSDTSSTDISAILAQSNNSTATAGAFVEKCVTDSMPTTYSTLSEMHTASDGSLVLIGINSENKLQRVAGNVSGEWAVTHEFILSQCTVSLQTRLCTLDAQGVMWGIGTDEAGRYTLYAGQNPQDLQTIEIDAFTSEDSIPLKLNAQSDGNVLLTVQIGESTVFYVMNGENSAPRKIVPGFYATPVLYHQGLIYAFAAGTGNITCFDINNGQTGSQYTVQLNDTTAMDGLNVSTIYDSNFLYADKRGIHKTVLGGTIRETFADNKSFALGNSSFRQNLLAVCVDGSYLLAGTDGNGVPQLYQYYFDPNYTPQSGEELFIWAMEDCFLLREAVSNYAVAHPTCTIRIEYGTDSLDSGMTKEDVIRALNVQIFAGEGPDVIILDQLPVDSYINQGLLADLSVGINTSDCYSSIVNCFENEKGIFAIPMLFRPGLMYCKSDKSASILSSAQSLTDLQAVLSTKSNFRFDGYYNLFHELYPTASAAIFPIGKNTFDETALREFLNVTKSVIDNQGIVAEYDAIFGNGENSLTVAGQGALGVNVPASMNWYAQEQDATDCACGNPSDYRMTYITIAATTKTVPTVILPLPGNVFEPTIVAGILSTSKNVDLGKQFIQCMIDSETEEVASRGSFNGFFVKKNVQLEQLNARNDGSNGVPTPTMINLDSVSEKLTTPANTDLTLQNAVYDEAKKLYANQQDLDTTLSNIRQKVELYYAERS